MSDSIAEEIVLLTRGFFSLPVLSGLGRLGILEGMLAKSDFTAYDFSQISNKKYLEYSFKYLARLGLVECADRQKDCWKVSELGKQVFQRSNSFYVPHSYQPYMDHYYHQLLEGDSEGKNEVDRSENIMGSGKTHQRYFPSAISFLRRRVNFDVIIDLGCGDGQFLDAVLKGVSLKKAVGVDLSEVAIQTTRENLRQKYPAQEIDMVCSNACDIRKWSRSVSALPKTDRFVISMWFLIHEISNHDPEKVIQFLNQIYQLFPNASLIVGEIVRQGDPVLVKHREESLMPEYLFFHDLSQQGVLSWKEYQTVLAEIPYKLGMERTFDEIGDENGKKEPAAFVWGLVPNEHRER